MQGELFIVNTTEKLIKVVKKCIFFRQKGWSPLMYAAKVGANEKVELLLEHGAETNVKNHVCGLLF